MRTQMIDGNSQSDVTAQDLEQLSRAPKRRKTEVGHCQKVCQDGAKLQGTTAVAFWVSKFVPALMSRGWNTGNKPLPKNWSGRENAYTELKVTLGKEGIRLIRMRQGVSSGSDEQVGSSSQSSVTQTNEDKDVEDVVGGEENVEDEEEVVRDDDDQEEYEGKGKVMVVVTVIVMHAGYEPVQLFTPDSTLCGKHGGGGGDGGGGGGGGGGDAAAAAADDDDIMM